MNKVFNAVAVYDDDGGGIYEWQGEADDAVDAEQKARLQAWKDNHPNAEAEGEKPTDMLGDMSIMDITMSMVAKSETVGFLRAVGKDELADRVETHWTR